MAGWSEDQCNKALTIASAVGCEDVVKTIHLKHIHDEYTEDVFQTLSEKYAKQFPEPHSGDNSKKCPPFLGYWVNLIPSAACFSAVGASPRPYVCNKTYCDSGRGYTYTCFGKGDTYFRAPAHALEQAAKGGSVHIPESEELTWLLPYHTLSVMGV